MSYLSSVLGEIPTAPQIILCIGLTLILSAGFAVLYNFIKRKVSFQKDMPITFVIFPVIVTGLVILVSYITASFQGTTAEARYSRAAIALFACLVLIKFRSQQRNMEDLTFLFFLTGFAFVMGLGYIWFALTLYAIIIAIVLVMYFFDLPRISEYNQNLKITIPEDINYENAFDDIFEQFTTRHVLTRVKSADMGTMFVLVYQVQLKKGISQKEMIDAIRARNGNLNVVMTLQRFLENDK